MARITLEQYVTEIVGDYMELCRLYPDGITIKNLCEYYGETTHRSIGACHHLSNTKQLPIKTASSHAIFIDTPTSKRPANLSEVQQRLLVQLTLTCLQHNIPRVRTNYSQLARVVKVSYGAIRSAIIKLETLQYIQIESNAARGRQNELVILIHLKDHKNTIEEA